MVAATSAVMVTQRSPDDVLYHELLASVDGQEGQLPFTLKRVGDCEVPAIIAAAAYAGHKYTREPDAPVNDDEPLKQHRVDPRAVPEGAGKQFSAYDYPKEWSKIPCLRSKG